MRRDYVYNIYDADPACGVDGWPEHADVVIGADSDAEAVEYVRDVLDDAAQTSCDLADGYKVGDVLHAIVRDADGQIVGTLRRELTAEDLGVTARDVIDWSTEASYVATFPDDDGVGACDVRVQVGEAGGVWWLRTDDDAGGEHEYGGWYATEADAREAARKWAAERHEGLAGEDAADYLTRRYAERAGEPSPDGDRAQQELRARHPGGHLLCGYAVRVLVDGQWVDADEARP